MSSADSTLRIYLARHGQSVLNHEQRLSGQADTVLTDKGLAQAHALCDVLRHEPISAIYASTLYRALQTAQPTAEWHGLPVQRMDELREINLGILEGRYFDNRDQEACSLWKQWEEDKYRFTPPGGEPYTVFASRVLTGLKTILERSRGSILIVGHRNTNELILMHLLSQSFDIEQTINVKNKYLYVIDYGADTNVNSIRLGGDRHGTHYEGLKTC